MTTDAIPLKTVAERLGKAEHTVRGWVRDKLLPEELRPERDGGRRKLVWREDQMPGLESFAKEREARRGWNGARSTA